MSQISQILDYVKSLNEKYNLLVSNAKKVQELPAAETANPEALLIVSELVGSVWTSKKLEIQKIIDGISLAGQNNTVREILLGEITEAHDLEYLFENNGITVSASELVVLIILQTINGIKIQRQFLWKLGKGDFNPIGYANLNTKVLELQPKYVNEIIADELTTAPDAIVYDFGTITDEILEVLNTASPARNYTDEEKIYYIRFTKNDIQYLYNFVGTNGIYGDGALQMVQEDLVLVFSSDISGTSGFVDLISTQTISGKKTFQASRRGSSVIIDYSGVEFHRKTVSDSSSNVKLNSSNTNAGAFTQTLQSKSGTVALLEDIPDSHFKGKYTSKVALETAHPTASVGDYAQVDLGVGSDVVNYNWDSDDGWVAGAAGSGATDTDTLPEGTTNLYFTTARVLATVLTGLSFAAGGAIVSTDSVLQAFGKVQKQINDISTTLSGKQNTLVAGTNISIDNTNPLAPVINASGGGAYKKTQTISGSLGAITVPQSEQIAGDTTENWVSPSSGASISGGTLSYGSYVDIQARKVLFNSIPKKILFRFKTDGTATGGVPNITIRLYAFGQNSSFAMINSRKIFEQTFVGNIYSTKTAMFITTDFVSTSLLENENIAFTIRSNQADSISLRHFNLELLLEEV